MGAVLIGSIRCLLMVDFVAKFAASSPLGLLVAAMRAARPDVTLQEMCSMLEQMREPTPCRRATWYPSSVKRNFQRTFPANPLT